MPQPVTEGGACTLEDQAFSLGRNNGQENAVLAFAENSRSEVRLEGGDGQIVGTLSTGGGKPGQGHPCIAHAIQAGALRQNPASGPDGVGVQADHAYTLEARAEVQAVSTGSQVRRLTPRECERLQGFPDDYTMIPYRGRVPGLCPDGPRYKAIGNSKAVFVVRWIGQRLQQQLERSA